MADERLYPDEIRIPITMQVMLPPGALQPPDRRGNTRPPNPARRPAVAYDNTFLARSPGELARDVIRHGHAIDAAMRKEAAWARRHYYAEMASTVTAAAPASAAAAEFVTVIAESITAVVALLDLPAFLAALAAVGAVTILYRGVRQWFADVDAARTWAGHLPDAGAVPEHLPIADPIPPLPPMQAGPSCRRTRATASRPSACLPTRRRRSRLSSPQ